MNKSWPLLLLLVAVMPAAAERFRFQILNNAGGNDPVAINDLGQLLGIPSYGVGGYVDTYGSYVYLNPDTPAGDSAIVSGFNNVGQAVGSVLTGNHVCVLWDKGQISQFTVFNAFRSSANGINDLGEIAGSYEQPGPNGNGLVVRGFVGKIGNFRTIDYPGAIATYATAVNDLGVVVGNYSTSTGVQLGFLEKMMGRLTSLRFPGSNFTSASSLNNFNVVAGTYSDAGNHLHGFLYRNGRFFTVDYAPASNAFDGTSLSSINDEGILLGSFRQNGTVTSFVAIPELF